MVRCMLQMRVCRVRVMRRRQMIVSLVMFGRFAVMPRRVFVVLRCPVVMVCCLFRHAPSSDHNLG
jgi:hypothetical protein